MKIIRYKELLLTFALLFAMAFAVPHPIKMSSSLIEYDSEAKRLQLECRVFIDDFEYSVNRSLAQEITVSDLSEEEKGIIEDYFERYYTIMVNDLIVAMEYSSSEVFKEQNVLSIKFKGEVVPLQKGDVFCVENRLFFQDFEFLQTNMTTVRLSPNGSENYFEAKHDNYALPINY